MARPILATWEDPNLPLAWLRARGQLRASDGVNLGWFRPREASKQGLTVVEHLGGGVGFWNVMRLYPEESLGVVMMGNSTSYDHESLLEAIAGVDRT